MEIAAEGLRFGLGAMMDKAFEAEFRAWIASAFHYHTWDALQSHLHDPVNTTVGAIVAQIQTAKEKALSMQRQSETVLGE